MVLRIRVGDAIGRVSAFAVIASLVASSLSHEAFAQDNGTLVWGGQMPAANEGYRPSPSAVDMFGTNSTSPSLAPPAPTAMQTIPEAAAAQSLANDLIRQSNQARAAAPSAPPPAQAPVPAQSVMMPAAMPSQSLSPPPVPMRNADELFGGTSLPAPPRQDPWAAMKAVTPGAVTEADRRRLQKSAPVRVESYASIEPAPKPRLEAPIKRRAPLVEKTPSGWRNLSKKEALCRAGLRQLGVEFTEPSPISSGKSCGIPHPVKVSVIAKGVAMSPPATLNCDAAFRISRWVDTEVKRAAHSTLGTRVAAVKNSSSYRCSRVAGSGGLSQHATGNALDVAGFHLTNGDYVDVERKGNISRRENAFQTDIRRSACRWFGTVLGPGYDYLHRNHFHLDAREREKTFCK